MSVLSITVKNEIAPRAILALFEGFTKDPVRSRLKHVERDLATDIPRLGLFRH
jgi:hypothetical protein